MSLRCLAIASPRHSPYLPTGPSTQHPAPMTSPDPRLFTLEEAERTLPLVRRIVIDLQDEYAHWRSAVGHPVQGRGVADEVLGDLDQARLMANLQFIVGHGWTCVGG